MRKLLIALIALSVATPVLAQSPRRGEGQDQRKQEQDAAAKKKRDSEWGNRQAPLPALRNAGPCPFVKVLYDAGRYIEFAEQKEASAAVGFTGEIQGISAGCSYKDDQPIDVRMEVLFELGKGPRAQGDSKTYGYWVAVTDRNKSIIAKEHFSLPVDFDGKDRVYRTDTINRIVIPRAQMTTSGANFEVLVGFDVTPEMAEFNRDGKRFRVNVAGTPAPKP